MDPGLNTLLWAVILAFAPVSEIRGAIPYLFLKAGGNTQLLLQGIVLSVLSNMSVPLIVIPLLSLIDLVIAKPWVPSGIKRLYAWMRKWGEKKALGVKKGSYIALAVFVGVPLPATGAWTGSLVAYVLGLDKKKSIIAIDAGVLMASLIVLAATYLGIEALKKIFML
ncbi:MAG: small multi-drug export protein [Desulfurococcus sp.]|nr:small multi-drug export protein [Desulfurococcus sp.]